MIRRNEITRAQAMAAIEHGELPDEVIGSGENVAVVLTQDWCSQWSAMERWIGDLEGDDSSCDVTIDVYHLLYNRKDYFKQFLSFKENVWQNRTIPYVRYYRKGRFIRDSNYVTREEFLAVFSSES